MLKEPASGHSLQDDFEWAERSEYWGTTKHAQRRGPPKKFRYREPLILCGHGVRLRMDHGTLLVRDGFTHYPQKAAEHRFFPGDANMPDRIVMLDGSGGISFDALAWMSEQKITLVQLDWRGRTQIVGGTAGYAAKPDLVEAQRAARSEKRIALLARWLVAEKATASVATLNEIFSKRPSVEPAKARIANWLFELRNSKRTISLPRLLGIEGSVAAAYFQAWHGVPLKWTGDKRKPIPSGWRELGPRTMGWRKGGENARHPINAMLNYGYGILISQLRAQIVAAGLDPSIGIMHGTSKNRIPLVYDLMEPLRPIVDRHVLHFALSRTFAPGDFTINEFGGCRLNPQMAKAVVSEMPHFREISELVREFIVRATRSIVRGQFGRA